MWHLDVIRLVDWKRFGLGFVGFKMSSTWITLDILLGPFLLGFNLTKTSDFIRE